MAFREPWAQQRHQDLQLIQQMQDTLRGPVITRQGCFDSMRLANKICENHVFDHVNIFILQYWYFINMIMTEIIESESELEYFIHPWG